MCLPFSTNQIFNVTSDNFNEVSLEMFHWQANYVPFYKRFLQLINVNHEKIDRVSEIPHMPVELFKRHKVLAKGVNPVSFFSSSGTSGDRVSKHYYDSLSWYQQSLTKGFENTYGSLSEWDILALLPSYLERSDSSLVYMVEQWLKKSINTGNSFFLNNYSALADKILKNEEIGQKTLLIGVSFALWDFSLLHPMALKNTTIMETGGMKGRKKEITREELHKIFKNQFQIKEVHSEYGMTELFSQAYSTGEGLFKTPPWMSVSVQKEGYPLSNNLPNGIGKIQIIDLSNIESCAFISTSDFGKINEDGTFEILGRFDYSDIRGCNLMY